MVSNGESRDRVSVRVLCAARPALEDERACGRQILRNMTRSLARDVLEGLQWVEGPEARTAEAEAKPFAYIAIDLVHEADTDSATPSVTMEGPAHWQAFELQQEPLNSLVRVLLLYERLSPGGAQAALAGYTQALSELVRASDGLVPASLDVPPLPDPFLVAAAYQQQLEFEYFGVPWPGDAGVSLDAPEGLRELLFFSEVAGSFNIECTVSLGRADWTFEASPLGGEEERFVHVCSGLGEALSAVPWQSVDRVEYRAAAEPGVKGMLLDFLFGRTGTWMPDFTVNGEPFISESERERWIRTIPAIAVTRLSADGESSRHDFFEPDALPQLQQEGLHVLRRGEITEFSVRLDEQELLNRLSVDTRGGDESAEAWDDSRLVIEFVAEDEELIDQLGSATHLLSRWVNVNGKRVIALHNEGQPSTLAIWDEDAQHAIGASIAYFSWWSDGGSAPISWDGGSEIVDLGNGWLQQRRWGDLGNETFITPGNVTARSVATCVLDLVAQEEATVAAALALEPLDPDRTLTGDERAKWENLIEELSVELTLNSDTPVMDLILASLETVPLYRQCREALREPYGLLGQQLRGALLEAVETGVIGGLMSGSWVRDAN